MCTRSVCAHCDNPRALVRACVLCWEWNSFLIFTSFTKYHITQTVNFKPWKKCEGLLCIWWNLTHCTTLLFHCVSFSNVAEGKYKLAENWNTQFCYSQLSLGKQDGTASWTAQQSITWLANPERQHFTVTFTPTGKLNYMSSDSGRKLMHKNNMQALFIPSFALALPSFCPLHSVWLKWELLRNVFL